MYPTSPQYRHSVVNKYYPPNNGGYKFTPIIINDEPVYESGNKAIVFKVIDDNSNNTVKALKLFLIDNKERFNQYEEISNFLNRLSSSFFVGFKFIENLIYVEANENQEENYFPGLIMEWADGMTLGSKVKELCDSQSTNELKKLTQSFKELSLFLLNSQMGHGDLKHDNLIVDDNLKIKVIDYDGLFVPAFENKTSNELGTDSFQHPLRKNTDFNHNVDHFSILTIYVSLIALSVNPTLYNKFNDQQNLLFTLEDFLAPDHSELFKILSDLKETKPLVSVIRNSLANDSIYIDKIKEIFNDQPPKIKFFNCDRKVILNGVEANISWEIENAYSVEINNGIGALPLSGEIKLKPKSDTIYKITAIGFNGETSEQIEIRVFPTPVIESLKIPTPIFETRLNINSISIQAPNIDLKINLDLNKFSQTPANFTILKEDIQNTKPLSWLKDETTTWNSISKIFDEIKTKINKK